jgi:hypothetical protein
MVRKLGDAPLKTTTLIVMDWVEEPDSERSSAHALRDSIRRDFRDEKRRGGIKN